AMGADEIMMVHNHPSGNLRPSNEDISLTKKLKDGGKLLDINVLDHLIVCNNAFYSFADDGLI
ncbi:MAG: JAB domain-containing protein, partial [Flavobacteriales bacterium]